MRIIVGAGKVKYDGWVSTQKSEFNLLSIEQWENITKDNEIEAILAEHVWEHLTYEEGLKAAENCYKFLKPGGYIRCAVPDKNFRISSVKSITSTYFSLRFIPFSIMKISLLITIF